jgi:subtilisin family serine protease
MNEITLKRGHREVTFKKLPKYFAMRLKRGRAMDAMALEACCGKPVSGVEHLNSAVADNLEVFTVAEPAKLEETMAQLRAAPASDVVTHVYALDETAGSVTIPTGTMTLQFKPEVTPETREQILAEFGLEVIEDIDFLADAYTVRLTSASKENPLKTAAALQKRPELIAAEPDITFQASLKVVPSDPLYREQWHLNNRGNLVGLTAGADVKAEVAWDITTGSREITVCVIDDGFDLQHPDFDAPEKIVAPRDFGQDDLLPDPVADSDNHGTACAGVAVAERNGIGVVGLAPDCALMPVRMGLWLSDEVVVSMFQHAIDTHADVISCSWSASAWNFPLSIKMTGIIHKAATAGRRNGKGCVILFAAGNEDRPLDGTKDGQVSHQGFALHADVLAVAASNSQDLRSDYSNFGPQLAICAPSSGSPGRRIVTTDRRGSQGYSTDDYTRDFGGTSSSTPLAAGLAALILSVNPELTSAEVKRIMLDTADKIDQANGQYDGGGHSPRYGHGRINAAKAVALAAGDTGGPVVLPEVLFLEHRVNKPIPDGGEISDLIPFPLEVVIRELEVSLDIKHTYRGDLRVVLRSPQGTEVTLQNPSGSDGQDDLRKTFRSTNEPDLLGPFVGKPAQGEWRLRIADTFANDVGSLVKWSLGVAY